jgi:glyoxylase I family protein
MAKATGIGGIFFRAADTDALARSDYFPANRQWMINLRVDDLDGLMANLRAAGIAVETRPEWDTTETGRFARILDPEGNPVELWEPPAAPAA